jgi:hypothetical protein
MARHSEHFTRSTRPGSAAAAKQQHSTADYEHDVTTPSQDDLSRANPSKGGQTHPAVEQLMRDHPGFFAEHPQSGSRSIKPKTPAQRARERSRSRPGHT